MEPATIPRIMGLVAIPFRVRLITGMEIPELPGRNRHSTVTAIML